MPRPEEPKSFVRQTDNKLVRWIGGVVALPILVNIISNWLGIAWVSWLVIPFMTAILAVALVTGKAWLSPAGLGGTRFSRMVAIAATLGYCASAVLAAVESSGPLAILATAFLWVAATALAWAAFSQRITIAHAAVATSLVLVGTDFLWGAVAWTSERVLGGLLIAVDLLSIAVVLAIGCALFCAGLAVMMKSTTVTGVVVAVLAIPVLILGIFACVVPFTTGSNPDTAPAGVATLTVWGMATIGAFIVALGALASLIGVGLIFAKGKENWAHRLLRRSSSILGRSFYVLGWLSIIGSATAFVTWLLMLFTSSGPKISLPIATIIAAFGCALVAGGISLADQRLEPLRVSLLFCGVGLLIIAALRFSPWVAAIGVTLLLAGIGGFNSRRVLLTVAIGFAGGLLLAVAMLAPPPKEATGYLMQTAIMLVGSALILEAVWRHLPPDNRLRGFLATRGAKIRESLLQRPDDATL